MNSEFSICNIKHDCIENIVLINLYLEKINIFNGKFKKNFQFNEKIKLVNNLIDEINNSKQIRIESKSESKKNR